MKHKHLIAPLLSLFWVASCDLPHGPPATSDSPDASANVSAPSPELLQASCFPSPPNLAAWFPGEADGLDRVSGDRAILGGGVTSVPGLIGNAFHFNGGNSRIELRDGNSDSLDFDATQSFSIELWLKLETSNGRKDYLALVNKRAQTGQTTSGYLGYNLFLRDNAGRYDQVGIQLLDDRAAVEPAYIGLGDRLDDERIHHLALVVDRALGEGRLYADGQQKGAFSVRGIGSLVNAASLLIGAPTPDIDRDYYFPGILDEISLYKRALTSQEVASIFQNGTATPPAGKCSRPVAHGQVNPIPLLFNTQRTLTLTGDSPSGSPLDFRLVTQPAHGSLAGLSQSQPLSASVTYTPTTGFSGDDSFSFTVSANGQTSEPATVRLVVLGCEGPPRDLRAWYPGDRLGTDLIAGHSAQLRGGAAEGTGQLGTAFSLDGINGRVEITDNQNLLFDATQSFTLEFWLRLDNLPEQRFVSLLDKRVIDRETVSGFNLFLEDGRPVLQLGDGRTSKPFDSQCGSQCPNLYNGFHHLAVTVDRGANQVRFYGDGLLLGRPLQLNDGIPLGSLANTAPLLIGAPAPANAETYLRGLFDELRIYGRALSESEILQLQAAEATRQCRVALSPITGPATVTAGTVRDYTATVTGTTRHDVWWSVMSATCGTIMTAPDGATGQWTAPNTPGSCILTARAAADPSKQSTFPVTVVARPSRPEIDAPVSVNPGQTGNVASITNAEAGVDYSWTISGGNFSGGASTTTGTSVTFTAGNTPGGTVTLNATGVNAAGTSSEPGTARVFIRDNAIVIVAPPYVTVGQNVYPAFVANPQSGATYSWTITGGNFAGGATTATGTSVTFTAGTTAGGNVTLRVTLVGSQASGMATSEIVDAPLTPQVAITGPATCLVAGQSYTASITNLQSNTTYEWIIVGGVFSPGSTLNALGSSVAFIPNSNPPDATVTLVAVATNRAGTRSDFGRGTGQIAPSPQTPSINAPPSVIAGTGGYTACVANVQTGIPYTWTITNGTFTGGTATATGACVAFAAADISGGCVTLSVTATNCAGATATGAICIPIASPVGCVLALNPLTGSCGDTSILSWTTTSATSAQLFQDGILLDAAPARPSGSRTVGPRAETTTYTMTVTGANGSTSSCTATLGIRQPQVTLTPSANTVAPGGTITLTAIASNLTPTVRFDWNGDGGTFSNPTSIPGGESITWTAPAIADAHTDTYTLTANAHNSTGCSASDSVTITVVGGPMPTAKLYTVRYTDPGDLCCPCIAAPATTGADGSGDPLRPRCLPCLATCGSYTVDELYADGTWDSAVVMFSDGRRMDLDPHTEGAEIYLEIVNDGIDDLRGVWALQATRNGQTVTTYYTRPSIVVPAYVTAGQDGYSASVAQVAPGVTYTWTITGGTFADGTTSTTGSTATFTADGTVGGNVTLRVTAQDAAQTFSTRASASSVIVDVPSCTFYASPNSVACGEQSALPTLYWNCTGAASGVLSRGVPPATVNLGSASLPSGQLYLGASTPNAQYNLTVSNAAGTAMTYTTQVTVQTPHVSISPSSYSVTSGSTLALTANVSGTATPTVYWTASCGYLSGSGSSIDWIAPLTTGTCTITAQTFAPDGTCQAYATATITTSNVTANFLERSSRESIRCDLRSFGNLYTTSLGLDGTWDSAVLTEPNGSRVNYGPHTAGSPIWWGPIYSYDSCDDVETYVTGTWTLTTTRNGETLTTTYTQ